MKYLIILSLLIISCLNLNVPPCSSSERPTINFSYQNGTSDQTTVAKICYDQSNLFIEWFNIDK